MIIRCKNMSESNSLIVSWLECRLTLVLGLLGIYLFPKPFSPLFNFCQGGKRARPPIYFNAAPLFIATVYCNSLILLILPFSVKDMRRRLSTRVLS